MQSGLSVNGLAVFWELKDMCLGLREGGGFGGEVKEVGRGALWAMVEVCILFQVFWEASERF